MIKTKKPLNCWVVADRHGNLAMAINRRDAERCAHEFDASYPHDAPHRAVELQEVSR